MHFHSLMVNWNPVTALPITPTLEQFVSTLLCLKQAILVFLKYKRHRGRAPDVLTNRQSRLMAYRLFVCWVRKGQPLGKKYRVTLPACFVKTIREEFPSPDGNYKGFRVCM
jgi:hypothetical protein